MSSESTALLLIDLQRDYFEDDELARCRDDLVATCNRLVEAARAAGVLVVEARTEHDPEGSTWTLSMKEDEQGMALTGSPGAERLPDLLEADQVVLKTRDSAFVRTDLEDRLHAAGVDTLVLTGVSTESCIAATAVDAFALDFAVLLVQDATASVDWELHDQGLERLQAQYRQEVVRSDELLARWAS